MTLQHDTPPPMETPDSRDMGEAVGADAEKVAGAGAGRPVSSPVPCRLTTAELFPMVYDKMRALAETRLQQLPPGQTLQATALVNEVFLKLAGKGQQGWDHVKHLYGAAAQAMRDILVEQARSKAAGIRGGRLRRIAFDDDLTASPNNDWADHLIDLDRALRKLEREDDHRSQIVLLRYFAGLTFAQIGQCLNMCGKTAEREWGFIRVWLHREMNSPYAAQPA